MHWQSFFSTYPALVVVAIATIGSLLAELRLGAVVVPVVVWEMTFGMLVGPHGLNILHGGELLEWFSHRAGLAGLFFMAGMELDLNKVRGRPLALAIPGWFLSLVIAICVVSILHWLPIHLPLMVTLVLTTTAMGTFMPMLRDSGRLDSKFGSHVVAAAAMGEFAPILAVSLALTRLYGAWTQIALMLGFIAVAVAAAAIALGVRPPRVLRLFERTMHSSTQLPVVLSLLLLTAMASLSRAIGLETVMGAFSAGMVVGLASRGEAGKVFRGKIEAICFGFLVPFFFVVSGMNMDVSILLHDPKAILATLFFLFLLLLVRGTPVVLYRHDLPREEWLPFALYSSTALPMVVAICEIGVQTGRLQQGMATTIVGAGLLSVLLFPTAAAALLSRGRHTIADVEPINTPS
jgi:Kef-type K+ transport system membrane component KefB